MSLILTTEHLLVINLSVEQLKKTCSFCRNVTDFEHLYSEHVYKTKQIKNTSVEASYEEFFFPLFICLSVFSLHFSVAFNIVAVITDFT